MDYTKTFDSDAYAKSNYLKAEEDILNILRHLLTSLGYTQQHVHNYVYARGDTTVYLALVDDIEQLNNTGVRDLLGQLTKNDIIITDNFIHRPTLAKICKLPNSWFGVYHYEPDFYTDKPDRFFSYKARRLDNKRLELFLEMATKLENFDNGYVSLDCYYHNQPENGDSPVEYCFRDINHESKSRYYEKFQELKDQFPYSNHSIDIDEVMQRSLINVVIETYRSDYTVAFSEKTFRALVTPRLWTLYSGRFSCKVLEQLGFDILGDIVDHQKYDVYTQKDRKVIDFVAHANPNLIDIKWNDVKDRCNKAAKHNIALLAEYKKQWPHDFAEWLPNVVATLTEG
jgi:hypothetical protein